jgi:SAM-dependent methyltransferase
MAVLWRRLARPSGSPLPFPPQELRRLVGPLDDRHYDNPSGRPLFPDVPPGAYDAVLDFGCGCGRIARQLIQQAEQPSRYLGVDLQREAIAWCNEHLAPRAPQFEFRFVDVANRSLNPDASERFVPFPAPDGAFSLAIAWSVFTHVLQEEIPLYLAELRRVLRPDGVLRSTWFLFDRATYPMLQDFQHALYVNHHDPTNAVIVDRAWLPVVAREHGLIAANVVLPVVRGYQWIVDLAPVDAGRPEVEIPRDTAPLASEAQGSIITQAPL